MRFRDRRFNILILVGRAYLAISEDDAVLPGNGFQVFMCFQQRLLFWFDMIFALRIWFFVLEDFLFFMCRFEIGFRSWCKIHNGVPMYQPRYVTPCHAQRRRDIGVVYNEQGGRWFCPIIRRIWSIVDRENHINEINYRKGILLRVRTLTHYFADDVSTAPMPDGDFACAVTRRMIIQHMWAVCRRLESTSRDPVPSVSQPMESTQHYPTLFSSSLSPRCRVHR